MALPRSHWLLRCMQDPLAHFLAAGALIFAGYAWTHGGDATARDIVIGEAEVARLRADAQAQWGRPPDERQLQALVQALLHEEVLVREAQALGLERDDTVVRRRLAQKMEFLAQQDVRTPDPAAVQAWFTAHAADYQQPATVSFEQRYFTGPDAARRARAALQALQRGTPSPGDPFMLAGSEARQDHAALARDYGPAFADGVFALPLERWSGPVASPHGQHLVRLHARSDSTPAPLASVYDRVAADLLNQRIATARNAAYQAWLAHYRVTLPAGMAPLPSTDALPQP